MLAHLHVERCHKALCYDILARDQFVVGVGLGRRRQDVGVQLLFIEEAVRVVEAAVATRTCLVVFAYTGRR